MLPSLQPQGFELAKGAIDELSAIAIGCNNYNLVCTTQPEFDKYTYAIAIVGMILGVVCILVFQYVRKKAADKIAAVEAKAAADEAESAEADNKQ